MRAAVMRFARSIPRPQCYRRALLTAMLVRAFPPDRFARPWRHACSPQCSAQPGRVAAELRCGVPHPRAALLDADPVRAGARRDRGDDRALPRHRRPRRLAGASHSPAADARRRPTSPAVAALRQRLIVTGDLDPAAGSSPIYDSYVEAGVRRFQARHGLNADRRHQRRDARRPERPGRDPPAPARAQHRPPARLFGQSRPPLRDREHPGRRSSRRWRTAWSRPATPPASARSTGSRRS